jgi:hypothetical protein
MTDAPELKPCPFCGGEAELVRGMPKGGYDRVECTTPGCWAEVSAGGEDEDKAIAAWSTRASPRVRPLEWDERYDGVSRAEYRPRHFYECHDIGRGWVCHETIRGTGHSIGEVWTTREEAKAAAQADYERRILGALA